MKLLFDENLSPALVERLLHVFPESAHHGFAIVSKDADFAELSILMGSPPKLIWIRRGNCSTNVMQHLLLQHGDAIGSFLRSDVPRIYVID